MKDEVSIKPRTPDEVGVPDPFQYMHPVMKANYGNWDWHDRPRPGVLRHVSKSGDIIYTVRAGTQRQMDVFTIRKLCDIGDTFADGHVRFTTRSNIEFMVADQGKVAPLIDELEREGFPVGGTGASVLPGCPMPGGSDGPPTLILSGAIDQLLGSARALTATSPVPVPVSVPPSSVSLPEPPLSRSSPSPPSPSPASPSTPLSSSLPPNQEETGVRGGVLAQAALSKTPSD